MAAASMLLTGCIDTKKIAIKTTTKVLQKGSPATKQESDFVLASRAIPGSLKTVETFHFAYPDIRGLTMILAEGYCQYGSGFVEDEWEMAVIEKRFEDRDIHSRRATKMFVRCMNYGLELLGKSWTKSFFGPLDEFETVLAKSGRSKRDGMMWVGMALGSTINQNKDRPEVLKHFGRAKAILARVKELDNKHNLHTNKPSWRLIPHLAAGMINTAVHDSLLGKGTNDKGGESFKQAMEISRKKGKDGKLGPVRYLLAKVYYARKYAVIKQNRKLFHDTLVEVLQTDPAIWPEQRLANEIAHRRALRYLKQEKDLF